MKRISRQPSELFLGVRIPPGAKKLFIMRSNSSVLRPGDLLEIRTDKGFLYISYIGKHNEYGDSVLVCPQIYLSQTESKADLFKKCYIAFYPATAAVKKKLAMIVGHNEPHDLPTRFRRPGARSKQGAIQKWIIEDGSTEKLKTSLTRDEISIPLASIWNHEMLIHKVENGWRPENEQ